MDERGSIKEVARVFLPLGFTAFGGPAAHISMLEEACVTRRGWVTRDHFLDLVGATNLIPGPNSTEMVLHLGYERAGLAGLLVAGACFIGPAVTITALLAWLYVGYGSLPDVAPWLSGVKPAVLAIVAAALGRLAAGPIKVPGKAALLVTVAAAVLLGLGEIPALFTGVVVGGFLFGAGKGAPPGRAAAWLPAVLSPGISATAAAVAVAAAVTPWKIFSFFLVVGSVLYGSGYVLIAFLEGGLVQELGWITQAELLDAIAVGQFTPGPVLSTATFVGWLIDGWSGASYATLGIFLPSFLFVLILNPWVPRLRSSRRAAAFLDAANMASLGLMAAVSIELGIRTLDAWPAWLIAGSAAVALLRFRVSAPWIVLAGAIAGRLLFDLGV